MICFKNSGLIELRAIKAFGVSVKPLTNNPIGQFGSGSKAAIAILLRTNHSVTLYRGLDRYTFGTKKVTARDKDFDFVTMTGPDGQEEELPFNTHVGEHWPSFAPFRELHSNVLDEGGTTIRLSSMEAYQPQPNETAFLIEGAGIEEAYGNRSTIFLDSQPRSICEDVAIHNGGSPNGYYRGVRVNELRLPSIFTYNLTSPQKLTEDRTLDTFAHDWAVTHAIAKSHDREFLMQVIAPPDRSYEKALPCYTATPSDEFISAYLEVCQGPRMGEISDYAANVFSSHNKGSVPLPAPLILNRIQEAQLKRAIKFCEAMGWKVQKYPIVVIPKVTGNLLARATRDGKILLTEELFEIGTKKLTHALYEEWTHLETGMGDETRELQTHLFQKIISLGEQLQGEAL